MNRIVTSRLLDKLANLELDVEGASLSGQEIQAGNWTRVTARIELFGGGCTGAGEDVNYSAGEQREFLAGECPSFSGRLSFAEFCDQLDRQERLFADAEQPASRLYRRWAFEAAALDLALQQRQQSLAAWLELPASPVRFVASMGLGTPPTMRALDELKAYLPKTRFKIDLGEQWSAEWVEQLAQRDDIDVIDFKAHYHGSFHGPKIDLERAAQIVRLFPETLIEDPAWDPEHATYLNPIRERIAWDAPIHSLADLLQLPFKPSWINMKPSRFGSIAELFRVYGYCSQNQIQMYGGGQFELGVGRKQIQDLAAIFHPLGPNDIAPVSYHARPYADGLPCSPLLSSAESVGFGAGSAP